MNEINVITKNLERQAKFRKIVTTGAVKRPDEELETGPIKKKKRPVNNIFHRKIVHEMSWYLPTDFQVNTEMALYDKRLETITSSDLGPRNKVDRSRRAIVHAGFFVLETDTDFIQCFSCGLVIGCWSETIPAPELIGIHIREGPRCKYIANLVSSLLKSNQICIKWN